MNWVPDLPPDAAVRATLVWVSLFGSVNFEVFGQYGSDTFTDSERDFRAAFGTTCPDVRGSDLNTRCVSFLRAQLSVR